MKFLRMWSTGNDILISWIKSEEDRTPNICELFKAFLQNASMVKLLEWERQYTQYTCNETIILKNRIFFGCHCPICFWYALDTVKQLNSKINEYTKDNSSLIISLTCVCLSVGLSIFSVFVNKCLCYGIFVLM